MPAAAARPRVFFLGGARLANLQARAGEFEGDVWTDDVAGAEEIWYVGGVCFSASGIEPAPLPIAALVDLSTATRPFVA